ncbi:MAG: serine hydrolase domain-containing protein [Bacteroidia bacterium]
MSTQLFAQQNNLTASLDSIIQIEANSNNFSGSVIIVENDKIIFSKSVGFANYESQIKNQLDTKSNIASVGKLFTKVVILQLIEEGKLKLTDPVSNFYPCFDSEPSNKITIADLLYHRSGLRDVYVSKGYIKLVKDDDPDFQEKVVKIISEEKLSFTPGTKSQYSNSGYYLLGAIASKIEGKSFKEVVTENIFKPLNMSNSGFARTGDTIKGHAVPHKMKKGTPIEIETNLIGDRPSGAGGEYSTVSDLAKIYLSIMNDTLLLSSNSKRLLFNFNNSEPDAWTHIKTSGKIVGFVGGDTRGWSAKIGFYLLKGNNYGVIICANFDNMAHELDLKLRSQIINVEKK